MAAKRAPGRVISAADVCTDEFIEWCKDEFPEITIDARRTWAAFWDICDGNGLEYRNFVSTCRNWVRRDVAQRKFGEMVMLAKSQTKAEVAANRGEALKARAAECGFREPVKGETFDAYEEAMNKAANADVKKLSNIVSMDLFKSIPK